MPALDYPHIRKTAGEHARLERLPRIRVATIVSDYLGRAAIPIEFHSATRALADIAADYKARYKLSLAGAFAAAPTKEKKVQLTTGDPEFKPLEKEIKIVWL
jgi:hypothetical protein